MKYILPTDFSPNAHSAMVYAINLLGTDKEYILLNTYQEPYSTANAMASITDVLKEDSEKGLTADVAVLRGKFGDDLKIETRSNYGSLSSVINHMKEEFEVRGVVMGTAGASGLKKFFLGSNTSNVIDDVKVSVIAVPNEFKYNGLGNIVFASDFKELKDPTVIDEMKELATRYGATIHIVHVTKSENTTEVDKEMEGIKLHYDLGDIKHEFVTVYAEKVDEGIEKYIEEHSIDLLAMVSRKQTFVKRLLQQSNTVNMSMLTKVPLFVMNER